jgi:predicted XRE-type DNA-binding protein
MEEIWKDIEGYEGLYQISNMGRVKSLNKWSKGKLKELTLFKNSYHKVNLFKNNKQKTYYVHQLVGNAFIDNPENKKGINHIDGNKLNNNKNNLEWATALENTTHAIKNNLFNNVGELNRESKLTESQVLEIDNLLKNKNLSQEKIAKLFNVNATTIHNIRYRKKWKYLFNN